MNMGNAKDLGSPVREGRREKGLEIRSKKK
jgi:hypothetical protein